MTDGQPIPRIPLDQARPLYGSGRVVPLTHLVKRGRKTARVSSEVPGSFLAFLPANGGGDAHRLYRILPEKESAR